MITSRWKCGASLPELALRADRMTNSAASLPWLRWAGFLLIAALGLAIRLPQLGARPMHTDEAVNAYVVGQLLAGEPFTYDPGSRHGPLLAMVALPIARLRGATTFAGLTESDLRLAPVLAGTATILLFGAAAELFGLAPCLIAALLFAGASLPVYYDRYFIHEPLMVAATFACILCGWRAWSRESVWFAALAGACAGLMLAAKETAVLHFIALAAAAVLFRYRDLAGAERRSRRWLSAKVIWPAALVFFFVTLALFTWFGSNRHGLLALLHGAPALLARAGGQGHQKPFWYYAQLLARGPNLLLLALAAIGLLLTLRKPERSPYRFLAYYLVALALIYTLISYKTPWLSLNLWLPLTLFAGRAIASLWRLAAEQLPSRIMAPAFCALAALCALWIARDTHERVFLHPADETNPYAYAHTSEDLLGLAPEIAQLARQDGLPSPRIAVIAADPWPLPWYLRHFPQVGFWQPGQTVGDADFYITSIDAAELYRDRLHNFRPEFFGARPGVLVLLWSPAPR
jgi:uncharacterized protein (TIGR03663 family)